MIKNLTLNIPQEVEFIIKTLNDNGHKAYIVGGCVRDGILGKEPKDWDITTGANPDEVKALFEKTIDTGLKHGTVTVVKNKQNFEITTFRTDGEYLDNRRPERVVFTSSLEDDLSRRDFTMNAIAYHPTEGFKDPFHGLKDIEDGIIRAVGNPDKRFKEDALRMLRAIRFSSQLDFEIERNTLDSIRENGGLIKNISMERIREELTKLLVSDRPLKFALLRDTNILRYILPEVEKCFDTTQNNPHHIYDVALHTLHAVSSIENSIHLRWTMLLHDIGKAVTKTTDEKGIDHFYGHPEKSEQMAEEILKRLRFDNKTMTTVCRLVKYHDRSVEPNCRAVRKAINVIGDDIFLDLLKVKEADKKAQSPEFYEEGMAAVERVRELYFQIKESNQCISLKDLKIDGSDLIQLGFKPGKEIGEVLDRLLEAVIENPELNNKETLIGVLKELEDA